MKGYSPTPWRKMIAGLSAVLFAAVACVDADRVSPEEDLEKNGQGQFSLTESLQAYNERSLIMSSDIEVASVKFENSGASFSKHTDRFDVEFKVCNIKDRINNGIFEGQNFVVSHEFNSQVIPISGGCLRWFETYTYNRFAPSAHLILHFQIKAASGTLGEIIKRIALNPWDRKVRANDYSGVRDITILDKDSWPKGLTVFSKENLTKALKGELVQNGSRHSILFGENFQIHPRMTERSSALEQEHLMSLPEEERKAYQGLQSYMSKQEGLRLTGNIAMDLKVQVVDSGDVVETVILDSGRFRIFMALVATDVDGSGKSVILSHLSPGAMNASSGMIWKIGPNGLQANIDMSLAAEAMSGNLALAVKVVPIDLPLNVKPMAAVYDLGPYNALTKSQSPPLRKNGAKIYNESEDFNRFIEGASNFANLSDSLRFKDSEFYEDIRTIREARLFYFSPLDIRFVRILPGETATDRTFQYSVKSCVARGLYGTPVGQGLQFRITTWDSGIAVNMQRETDSNGCLTWFGVLSHKYYQKEVLISKEARVKFIGVHKNTSMETEEQLVNKFERTFEYYMNPWDAQFTFGWDSERTPENYINEIEEQKKNAPTSRIFIADFRYETLGFRYEIDRFMKLKVKKTVLLKTFPMALKYNSIVRGRSGTEPLRDGVYLMKIAMQKDYLDPAAKNITLSTYPNSQEPAASKRCLSPNDPGLSEAQIQERYDCRDNDMITAADKKQYISVQEKLVRVLGGKIVTPVEFTVEDLRLMRIRNQMFIQLQTIDENRLRLASLVDQKLNSLLEASVRDSDGNVVEISTGEERFVEIMDFNSTMKEINSEIDKAYSLKNLEDALLGSKPDPKLTKYLEKNGRRQSFEEKIKSIRNLVGSRFDDETLSEEQKSQKLADFFVYIDSCQKENITSQNCYRNHKYQLTNDIMRSIKGRADRIAEVAANAVIKQDQKTGAEKDWAKKYFQMGHSDESFALKHLFADDADALKAMKFADFTVSPLTPNFSFDLLANDGPGEGENAEFESGLPGRTFVGPITFLFNTNGSALRPTDILEEGHCLTATCSVADRISQGVPDAPVPRAAGIDGNGDLIENPPMYDPGKAPFYALGDTPNADYENDPFYGYLGEYVGKSVDDLIDDKIKMDLKREKRLEAESNIEHFLKAYRLKYVTLKKPDCVKGSPFYELDRCQERSGPSLSFPKKADILNILNDRIELDSRGIPPRKFDLHFSTSNQYQGELEEISESDLEAMIRFGWKATGDNISSKSKEMMFRRMCFGLSQQIFEGKLRQEMDAVALSLTEDPTQMKTGTPVEDARLALERKCQRYTTELFHPGEVEDTAYDDRSALVEDPPITFERKLRVYDTTKRYFFRGGKSLNINVGNSFGLRHNNHFSKSSKFSPTDWLRDGLGGILGSVPIVGGAAKSVFKSVVGAFGYTYTKGENVAVDDGISVQMGTYLVSQEANFDIEVGEYERCMVVRFNMRFMKDYLEDEDGKYARILDLERKDGVPPFEGLMICTGVPERGCEAIAEKYYFFTQHFTQGDLLDPADVYNHPWLLQLRGYRDFLTFVHGMGGQEQKYVDRSTKDAYIDAAKNDLATMNRKMVHGDKVQSEMAVLDKKADADWSLKELGRVYTKVLPTFPSLYTYIEDQEPEYPASSADAARDFENCEASQTIKYGR